LEKTDKLTTSGRFWLTRQMPWRSEVYLNILNPAKGGQRFRLFHLATLMPCTTSMPLRRTCGRGIEDNLQIMEWFGRSCVLNQAIFLVMYHGFQLSMI
jgi:hypothetical protein